MDELNAKHKGSHGLDKGNPMKKNKVILDFRGI